MIEPGQAEQIVYDCIQETVDTDEKYSASKPLGRFGLIASEFVSTFKLEIRNNNRYGVKFYNHKIMAKDLKDITSETLAGAVENIIIENADPIKKARVL